LKRLLLDTEALIWWDENNPKLGGNARAAIQDARDVYVSAASAWEIAIKTALGKLRTTRRAVDAVVEGGFLELPIVFEHAEAVLQLPPHHRDPFDRLLIAVARLEDLTVVTSDDTFQLYGVPLIDARR
jgi:PIN domain nuclease of toxin-antitoxin system